MPPTTASSRVKSAPLHALFAPVDPSAAASFRVLLALMLTFAFWPSGLRPGGTASQQPLARLLYEQVFLTAPYWLVAVVLLALLGLGWRPRPLGFVLAALLAPLAFLETGQLSRHVLLVTLLAFSLLRSDARHSLRTWLGGLDAVSAGPIWPVHLIRLQLSALYAVNALAKTTPAYLSGDVLLGFSTMLSSFRVDLTGGLPLGSLVVPVWLLGVGSTLAEWSLAIGFWFRPARLWVALFGVFFHAAANLMLDVFALDVVSVFLYLAFLLPFERSAVENGEPGRPGRPSDAPR
jgi:hypothetical protein